MSLATRCTNCGTVFRVVQDQLKVSEGWVRCGRCDHVFNAIEGLFDLERDAPPGWKPPPAPPSPPAVQAAAQFQPPEAPPPDDDDIFDLSEDDRIHSRFFQPEQADVEQTPAESVAARDRVEFAEARFNEDLLAESGDPEVAAAVASPPATASKGSSKPGSKSSSKSSRPPSKGKSSKSTSSRKRPEDEPGFVRQAKERARWNRPAARLALGLASLLLVGTLGAQVAIHQRDYVAARWPQARPLLQAACAQLHCRIEAPRRIHEITVESSSLSPAEGNAAYRLSLLLRNRGTLPLAMPSIDLTLTDSAGQLVSRRALSPADFNLSSTVIAADSETPLQLVMTAEGKRLSGYTVEVFYP
jgi:predicted Zn finger-like uncharacterized protein